jgi:hypothetical protein
MKDLLVELLNEADEEVQAAHNSEKGQAFLAKQQRTLDQSTHNTVGLKSKHQKGEPKQGRSREDDGIAAASEEPMPDLEFDSKDDFLPTETKRRRTAPDRYTPEPADMLDDDRVTKSENGTGIAEEGSDTNSDDHGSSGPSIYMSIHSEAHSDAEGVHDVEMEDGFTASSEEDDDGGGDYEPDTEEGSEDYHDEDEDADGAQSIHDNNFEHLILDNSSLSIIKKEFKEMTQKERETFDQELVNIRQLLRFKPGKVYTIDDLQTPEVHHRSLRLLFRARFSQAKEEARISPFIEYNLLDSSIRTKFSQKSKLTQAQLMKKVEIAEQAGMHIDEYADPPTPSISILIMC